MKICAYLHVSRCLEPCGGVGRHANSLLKRLARREGFEVSTLFARSALGPDGRAPDNFPLRDLPARHLPGRELLLERAMRLTRLPLQQISSTEQALPHWPQCAQLEATSTQASPQRVLSHGGGSVP